MNATYTETPLLGALPAIEFCWPVSNWTGGDLAAEAQRIYQRYVCSALRQEQSRLAAEISAVVPAGGDRSALQASVRDKAIEVAQWLVERVIWPSETRMRPHVGANLDQEVTLEWWRGDRKLIIYVTGDDVCMAYRPGLGADWIHRDIRSAIEIAFYWQSFIGR